MSRQLPRLAALSLCLLAGLAACKQEPAADAASADPAAAAPTAAPATAGDRKSVEITGAGATFIYPLLSKWSDDYNKATGARINYQSIGSGGGIAQIKARTGKLRLSGAVLADIFLGKVATWNDPAIAALNPGLPLPSSKINVVHRSDGSGTTFNFVNYLSKVSPAWKATVGEGTSVNWPGGIGGKGNEGVAAYVKQIKGSIGYVELAYATENRMAYAGMQNAAGNWVQPSAASFAAAAASADWKNARDFSLVVTDAPGADAWPITATNFILVYKQPKDAKRTRDTLDFFKWAFEQGQAQADALHFVPLPAELVQQIEAYWASDIKA